MSPEKEPPKPARAGSGGRKAAGDAKDAKKAADASGSRVSGRSGSGGGGKAKPKDADKTRKPDGKPRPSANSTKAASTRAPADKSASRETDRSRKTGEKPRSQGAQDAAKKTTQRRQLAKPSERALEPAAEASTMTTERQSQGADGSTDESWPAPGDQWPPAGSIGDTSPETYEAGTSLDTTTATYGGTSSYDTVAAYDVGDAATTTDDPDAAADQLVSEIAGTRQEMSGTIGALAEKLDPPMLMEQAKEKVTETATGVLDHAKETVADAASSAVDQAKETVREATVGKVEGMVHNAQDMMSNAGQTAQEKGGSIVDTIKQNPIPAALAGIGIWMLWRSNSSSSSQKRTTYRTGGYYDTGYQGGTWQGQSQGYQSQGYQQPGAMDRIGSTASGLASTVGDTAGNVAGTVGQTAGNVASTVGETAGNVVDTVGQTAGNVAAGAGRVVGQVGETAGQAVQQVGQTAGEVGDQLTITVRRLQRQATRAMQDNPLAVGAAAVAVGAAVGLALPSTQKEQELMGGARTAVMQRAADTLDEASIKVSDAVNESQS